MARPLWIVGTTFFLTLWLSAQLPWTITVLLSALAFLFFLLTLLFRPLRRSKSVQAALLSAAAAFCVFACKEALVTQPLQARAGQTVEATFTVLEEPTADRPERWTIQITEGALPEGTKLYLWAPPAALDADAFMQARGELTLSSLSSYPFAAKADGIGLQAAPAGELTVLETPRPWRAALADFRTAVRLHARGELSGDVGALVQGICFGYTGQLSDAVTERFRRAGVSHLLAVSGLHTAILAQALLGLLRLLRVPRRLAAGLTMGGVAGFMWIVGAQPSVLRAGAMCLLTLLGMTLHRAADARNSLGFAVLVIALCNPYAVYDVGLLLSFASTAGLLLLYPVLQRGLRRAAYRRRAPDARAPWWLRPAEAAALSVAAIIPTLPILAACFGELSVYAPLSNLLTVFPSTLLMLCGCAATLLSAVPFLGFAAQGLFFVAGVLARYLLLVTDGVSRLPLATVSMRDTYLLVWLAAAFVLVGAGWHWLRWTGVRRGLALACNVLLLGVLAHTIVLRGVTTVTVLDAGDNAAVLLEKDGHTAVVASGDSLNLLDKMEWELRSRGVRKLDFLLLPNLEDEALRGLPGFVQAMPVDCLLTPAAGTYADIAQAVAPRRLVLEETGTVMFWADAAANWRADGWVRLTFGDTALLLCPSDGDARTLPEHWRHNQALLFTKTPPLYAAALSAQHGVLCCGTEVLPYVSKGVPWGAYPIALPAQEGAVELQTRGKGDISR